MKILEELWYGNITPIDMLGPYERAHMHLYGQCEQRREALEITLNDSQKKILDSIFELWMKNLLESQKDAFTVGFRLGSQLMVAAVYDMPE